MGALTCACLAVGLTSGTAGAAGTPSTAGEAAKDVGPVTAPVDAGHASPAKARKSALASHKHHLTGNVASTTAFKRVGRWSTLSYKLPLRAVHATLLRTGKFLLIAGSGNVLGDNVIGNFKAYLWDPATGALISVPVPYDAFCSGHLVDANGDVMVFGGTVKYSGNGGGFTGSDKVYKFVVATSAWVAMPSMSQGRWYPTNVIDGKNRYLTYSGKDASGVTDVTHEIYDPVTRAWTPLADRALPLYPGLHLLKNGRVAYTGAHFGATYYSAKPATFDPLSTTQKIVADPHALLDLKHRNGAMSALVGSADKQLAWIAGGGFPAVKSTYFIDLNAAKPTVVAGPSLPAAKGYVSVSHLPDMTAFETGGGTGTDSPVYEASILNPRTRKLTAMAPPTVPRTYHSSSVTLPNGRVVTFGGDPATDGLFELRIEIFSPPYLFRGTRPRLTAGATEMRYGRSYKVRASATGATLASAVIMRPGSATHALDANQRVLRLTTATATGGLTVTLPTNTNLAPPGWYLLFVNDSRGRPSVGRWIHLT